MTKKISLLFAIIISGLIAKAQTKPLYDPAADAARDLEYTIMVAKSQNKHVLIQAGGNWCIWCLRFEDFVKKDSSLSNVIQKNYIVYHLNWSKENENKKIFAKYGFPQRFGFPVFIILNGKGERIHTQQSDYLEEGKSYSTAKVKAFFEMWTPRSIDPSLY
ncbi:MAG: thioredoxin family protein [Sphingobacteriales bacterium]|nr:MAG: thioredoxin family protein [Sphingobacteriales bacterium]